MAWGFGSVLRSLGFIADFSLNPPHGLIYSAAEYSVFLGSLLICIGAARKAWQHWRSKD